tara:strand:- start:1888 stop:2049 length:162 start_codon:yes stop_codon:yes gene_type:complete
MFFLLHCSIKNILLGKPKNEKRQLIATSTIEYYKEFFKLAMAYKIYYKFIMYC